MPFRKPISRRRFDYVIVGAGSAGCVLAARLSEDPDIEVLLIEAGPLDSRREIQIPVAFSRLFKSELDWSYETVPQPRLADRRLYWPRGKVVGGSSAINAMIYIRGHPADYDGWAADGCAGWSFRDVLPYFKRSEDFAGKASERHGSGGGLTVSPQRSPNPLSAAFVDAAERLGYARNDDFNGAEQLGFGLFHVTQRNGRRCSAADAFLRPAIRRPNLSLLTHTFVTEVTFDGRRAAGVACISRGERFAIAAEREIILAGGAINSPQLLMLSGIGPAVHLRDHGIDVVADAPGVGSNLQDHLAVPVCCECNLPITLASAMRVEHMIQYALARRGPLSSNVAEAGGFVRTQGGTGAPDLQFHFGPVFYLSHGLAPPERHGFSIGPTLIGTHSRGTIRLASADPFAAPLIDPNYLSDDSEMQILKHGIAVAREIIAQPSFDRYRGREVLPGRNVTQSDQIDAHIRQSAETLYHPVGTCRMGTGAEAVVDPQLRVNGVDSLRVADASIMPHIPSGNTNAAVMMIAEKAADLIRGR